MKKFFFMIMILMVSVVVFGQENDSPPVGLGFMFMTPTDNFFSNNIFGFSISAEGLVGKKYTNNFKGYDVRPQDVPNEIKEAMAKYGGAWRSIDNDTVELWLWDREGMARIVIWRSL